jgi:hypothetical protein
MRDADLTHQIIGAAIDVHRELGPGLLENVYEECLCHELFARGIPFEKQKPIPVVYKGAKLDCGYRADIVVGGAERRNPSLCLEVRDSARERNGTQRHRGRREECLKRKSEF